MTRDTLAWIFREICSRIVASRYELVRKLLKGVRVVAAKAQRNLGDKSDREVTIKNFDRDIIMTLNPARSMGGAIYWTGFHELRELMFLHRYLTPEMVFADIGANQGEYALFVAKRLRQGTVLAFEPTPSMLRLLNRNIESNNFKNIQVLGYGLSNTDSVLPIYEVKDLHEGLATLYPGGRASSAVYNAQLRVLDQVFDGLGVDRLDFIKIDIEGGELNALRGAQQTIRKYKPYIMVEINQATYQMAGYKTSDVLNLLTSLGYKPFALTKEIGLTPCHQLPSLGNLIFKPE